MTTKYRLSNSGITLLEVLLSLAIMAMIGVGIGSLFDTGSQVWQRIEDNQHIADEAINRTELRQKMEAMPVVTAQFQIDTLFRGDATGFAFAATVPDGIDRAVWTNVKLAEDALITSEDDATAPLRTSLSQTTFTYYGRKTVRDEAGWHNDWDNATILPRLIKIESWQTDGTVNPPLAIQPGKLTRQMEISLSSLVPPN